jgi:putative membrane protein
MKNAILVGTAVLALSAAPSFAQAPPAGQTKTPPAGQTKADAARDTAKADTAKAGAKMAGDQTFVKKAAIGGMAEVELGTLAKDKASSDQVKQFAQRMVDDHGKANDELKTLAQNKNITLPTELDAKHKAVRDRLSKLSGAQFDKAYMQAMLKDHREDVSEFRSESRSAKDPDVKAFAAKTLPTLEDHLKLAQQDSKAVATSGTKSSAKKPVGK